MKRFIPALMFLLLFVTRGYAQAVTDEAVHQELRKLKTTMETALNRRDLDSIVANVDENVVFTTMNGDVCRGADAIRRYFHQMLTAPGHVVKDVKVSFTVDQLTTLYGGDTGIAYGGSNDHYELMNGETFNIRARWSCTMVRKDNRWVIASFHYSANIFDNPVLNRVKRLIAQAGVAAAIGGILLGALGGWFLGRRKRAAPAQ